MKLRVGKQAQRQADRIEVWWVEHRPDAQSLFLDELEVAFRFIRTVRGAGVRWPTLRRPKLRRILMPRTNTHVYFVVDEDTHVVQVHAVWGAPKGRGPKL